MRLSIDARADSLRARNRVDEARKRAELAKQAKAFEIIGDSGDGHENDSASEIIQDFPHCHAGILDTVTTDGKCLKYKELSGNCHASWRASGDSTPPLRGRNRLRGLSTTVHPSPSPTLPETATKLAPPSPSPTLPETATRLASPSHSCGESLRSDRNGYAKTPEATFRPETPVPGTHPFTGWHW